MFAAASIAAWLLIVAVSYPMGGTFRAGPLLDPANGLWRTARLADARADESIELPGLSGPVRVVRDERGVPHIFAPSDEDAVRAFGYVVAQDRLFQMDFLRRYTSGRLSEVMGAAALPTDRAMLQTGIEESVGRNIAAARKDGRRTFDLFSWFAEGVNAYLEDLEERDLPFEFRLLGYRPAPFSVVDPGLIGWNLVYDLTYRGETAFDPSRLAELGPGEADLLFGPFRDPYRPIVPAGEGWWLRRAAGAGPEIAGASGAPDPPGPQRAGSAGTGFPGSWARGFEEGKGSNNWAVGSSRSTTGAPILAGDMHLSLTLPSIWYEVHLVTPDMDVYGVTVPGVPLPIEAFNRDVGWAFTNTGADQVDHLRLEVDGTRTRYLVDGEWRPLRYRRHDLPVRGAPTVTDSIAWSHWGPVSFSDPDGPVAVRWVGHDTLRTFDALWEMVRATDYASFERALRSWDSPMQNILYAGRDGRIAIRSTGYLPIRADGGGPGMRDGTTSRSAWIGRVPFEDLPASIDPARGYLASTNQYPAGPDYPYYVGVPTYAEAGMRSVRIDELLGGRERHAPDDLARYQSDVTAVHATWLNRLLVPVEPVSERARRLKDGLARWDGTMSADRWEPLGFDLLLDAIEDAAWDEPVFATAGEPPFTRLLALLEEDPGFRLFDRTRTPDVETGTDLLGFALARAADSLASIGGEGWETARWGDHHTLLLRHITMTPALQALWRGPFPFPGTNGTLSPGRGRRVTFSASWRVVVDFAGPKPVARGVYAGGASGNPFSRRYDLHVDDFNAFRYRDLRTPESPEALADSLVFRTLTLTPASTHGS